MSKLERSSYGIWHPPLEQASQSALPRVSRRSLQSNSTYAFMKAFGFASGPNAGTIEG
jgi:hypothetical protein